MSKKLEKKDVLATLPDFEVATRIGTAWFDKVLAKAKDKGFQVKELRSNDDVSSKFNAAIASMPGCFHTGVGHGSETQYTGQDYSVLIQSGVSDGLLDGRPWYALSCKVGKRLGKDVVSKGCPAFIGYEENFTFMADQSQPDGGELARPFAESSNIVVETLINGGTFNDAYKASQEKFKEWYNKSTNASVKRWLLHDMECQVGPATSPDYGNGAAKITDSEEDNKKRLDIVLKPVNNNEDWELYGQITNEANNRPIMGATVALEDKTAISDRDGNYSLKGIVPGSYTLNVAREGFESKSIAVTIP